MAPRNPPSDGDGPVDQSPEQAVEELTRGLREALQADSPLPFLAEASTTFQALKPRDTSEDERKGQTLESSRLPEGADLGTVLEAFVGSGEPALEAMAYAVTRLGTDQLLRTRTDRLLGAAIQRLPQWLHEMDEMTPTTALQAIDPACAGANVAIGVDLAGHDLTVVGFIDFDLGSALTDAYVLDVAPEEYARMWTSMGAASPQVQLDLADARTRLTAGIDISTMTVPPYENDTWPGCQPIVEWVLRALPTGGTDFATHQLTASERSELAAAASDSPRLGPLAGDPEVETIIELLLDFRTPHNDPLLWSVKAVEIFLTYYAPRRLMAPRSLMIKFPDTLRAMIDYGHSVRDVPADVTAEALTAVRQHTPKFEAAIEAREQQARGSGPEAAALRDMLGGDGDRQP